MKLSENNRQRLYRAISEPIMVQRIAIMQSKEVLGEKNANDIDAMMYRLEQKIWREVKEVLRLKD